MQAEQSPPTPASHLPINVMDASGRAIESKYLEERPWNERWYNLIFPKEMQSNSNFRLWNEALLQIQALRGRLHIGGHLRQGHKVWPWKYIKSLQLFHIKEDGVDLYEPALGEGARTRANRCVCTKERTGVAPRGGPCTIGKDALAGKVTVLDVVRSWF